MIQTAPLIHTNEFHLIDKRLIAMQVERLVQSLGLAAGSTTGFDLYKVVESYFTDLETRHAINFMLSISESGSYYEEEMIAERALTPEYYI